MAAGDMPIGSGSAPPQGPAIFTPVALAWRRISPSLVPILAVVTALIATVPFMVFTAGDGNLSKGLGIAQQAYTSLLEGSIGLAINPVLEADEVELALQLAQDEELTRQQLLLLAGRGEVITDIGIENVRELHAALLLLQENDVFEDNEAINTLGQRLPDIRAIGEDRLREIEPLLRAMDEDLSNAGIGDLAEQYALAEMLEDSDMEALIAQLPIIESEDYNSTTVLETLQLIDERRFVILIRILDQLAVLDELGFEPRSEDADTIIDIFEVGTDNTIGADRLEDLAEVLAQFESSGISDITELANQLRLVLWLYDSEVITENDVVVAITEELPAAIEENLVVRRPNNRILVHENTPDETTSIVYDDVNTPDDTSDDVPRLVYLRVANQVVMFFPSSLEETLNRAIPFVIAGLAVALGFKAGLFNIGAEGQLYAGATLAAAVGFGTFFVDLGLPSLIHILLVLIAGILGGAFWGFIPGVLKAYTGAHEVITTIMLNFVAIRLVDWLIKSTEPVIFLDEAATAPRTPFHRANRLPTPVRQYRGVVVLYRGHVLTVIGRDYIASREQLQAEPPSGYSTHRCTVCMVVIGGLFLAMDKCAWQFTRRVGHYGLDRVVHRLVFRAHDTQALSYGLSVRTPMRRVMRG